MANITTADDAATFKSEVLESAVPVVVDFWATWCGPCRQVSPEVEAIAEHNDKIKVVKVDVDANQDVAAAYGIQSIPTIALFEGGKPVAASIGAKPRAAIEADLGLANA